MNFAGAAMFLLIAMGALTGGSAFLAASAEMRGQFGWGLFMLIGAVCLVLAGLAAVLGIGFWKLLNRSRILQIVLLLPFLGFQVLLVVGAMMHFSLGRMLFRVILLGLGVWVLTYLFKSQVKRAFCGDPLRIQR
jgi:hypothetical protein